MLNGKGIQVEKNENNEPPKPLECRKNEKIIMLTNSTHADELLLQIESLKLEAEDFKIEQVKRESDIIKDYERRLAKSAGDAIKTQEDLTNQLKATKYLAVIVLATSITLNRSKLDLLVQRLFIMALSSGVIFILFGIPIGLLKGLNSGALVVSIIKLAEFAEIEEWEL